VSLLRRWQAKHLLLAWGVYWVALVLVALHSAIGAAVRALNAPKGHGTIGASVDNGTFTLKIASDTVHWSGSTSLTAMALWFAGPPLLLWLLWLVTRRAPASVREPERVN
jgi:hypothetical protein